MNVNFSNIGRSYNQLLQEFDNIQNSFQNLRGYPLYSELQSRDPDEKILREFSTHIIAGFLNLGETGGWPEGHDPRAGAAFVRFSLKNYLKKGENLLGKNKIIFESSLKAFRQIGSLYVSAQGVGEPQDGHRPRDCRVCYDAGVMGWQKHAIARMTGNLASEYLPNKPFFEILINSARVESDDPGCRPFFVTVYRNEKELDERRMSLIQQKMLPGAIAHFTFYDKSREKPANFLEKNNAQLGPNATRILKALAYLENVTINAQKVGNCWFKQPMRCLLASLYLELISLRPELSPENAWIEATEFYKRVQRSALEEIDTFIQNVEMTPLMEKSLQQALKERRNL